MFADAVVFDGTGTSPAPADVVVEDGRVLDVGVGLDGDVAVDCSNRCLLPGLFDCHVHLTVSGLDQFAALQAPFSLHFYEAARNMRATLAAGITTVRDAAGADLGVRVAQEQGLIAGPRARISVNMISQTGGHNDDWQASGCLLPWFVPHPGRPPAVVDGPDEMRRKVRELIRAGADVIKIATSGGVLSPRDDPRHVHFRDDEVAVAVEEAAAGGRQVMAHASSAEGVKLALRNGVRSIEHGDLLDDEAIDLMLERDAWLVPTLMAGRGILAARDSGLTLGAHILSKAEMLVEAQEDSVRRAVAAGVRIAMGTDSGVTPHGQNLDELAFMVGCGMTPTAALHAATGSAAQLMGLDHELGSLEPGKRADLVILDGDPSDITALTSRIRRVYQDGRLVYDTQADGWDGSAR